MASSKAKLVGDSVRDDRWERLLYSLLVSTLHLATLYSHSTTTLSTVPTIGESPVCSNSYVFQKLCIKLQKNRGKIGICSFFYN